EKRLEQWECILHDQHGRLLPQRLANGPLCHHHFAQFRRKEGTPPPTHVAKKRNFKNNYRRMGLIDDAETAIAPLPDADLDALAIRVMLAVDRHQDDKAEQLLASGPA